MPPLQFDANAAGHVLVAFMAGLAVGIEREWSGHASGPHARFGGLRTFTLLGLISGMAGWLWTSGCGGLAIVLLAAAAGLVVVAYAMASRVSVGATTEVAALVVLTAGVLAGAGGVRVSSALIAATVLMLVEKRPLHGMVTRLDDVEIRAGARFAVMAVVILPLVPAGPYGPLGGVRPHQLWVLVLLLSGLSFSGYMARRVIGNGRGYALAGLLGGLVSSTSVTLSLAQVSRRNGPLGRSLAAGTLGASVVMLPRMLLITALLYRPLALTLWPWFVAPAAIGLGLAFRGMRLEESTQDVAPAEDNPLGLSAAIKLAVLFQVVLYAIALARAVFGAGGLYASVGLVGLTEVDAVTISLAQNAATGLALSVVTRAVLMAALANTLTKLGITLFVGRGTFRRLAAAGLALMAGALGGALYWLFIAGR
jgi:uncharacterized membrane protein (DUF4010 family)